MNIIVDLRPLIGLKTSGVKIYMRNLLSHILKVDSKNNYFLWINSYQNHSEILNEFRGPNVKTIHTSIPNKLLNIGFVLFKRPLIDKLLKIKADLFFMPDFRPFAVSRGVKTVCTIHDLSYEHFTEYFSLKTRFWHNFIKPKKIVNRCKSIIAVSDFTKNDLIKTYGIRDEKVTVIHEGHPDWQLPHRNTYLLPEKYFLCLSAIEPRKNLQRLIEAFMIFKKTDKQNIKLVIAGESDKKIFAKIELTNSPDIILTGFIDEKDKAYLYMMSEAFIYPSLFEGFGLPLIEAISLNVPVITSNTSVMPEICGNAALYFDPTDTSSIVKAIHQVMIKTEKEKIRSFCNEQSDKFTWASCAAKTIKLFESLGS